MRNEIQIFNNPEFGNVRTIMIDGEPWFVGNDCARALGYKNLYNGVSKNVDEDDRRVSPVGSASGIQPTTIINESGLYSLIFGSKLESAKKFKKWVTSEVLPQLRRTGNYQLAELQSDPLKLLEVHYEAIKQVDKKVDTLSERVDKIELDLPILPIEADRITTAAKRRGVAVLGGKDSAAYQNRSLRQKLYNNLYANLKYNFGVSTYKAIKRNQCNKAVEIICRYEPPVFLANQIAMENAQLNMA